MGRPKGSKNKVCLAQREKHLQDALSVERQEKKERRKKIASTISTPTETETLSSGTDVVETATTRVKKGWINIQRNPKGGFYTGGDIHDDVETAKRFATKNTLCQQFIAFEYKL